ncbi:MAG: hypothetical protein AAF789_12120 [Bacteroidota bacterium]
MRVKTFYLPLFSILLIFLAGCFKEEFVPDEPQIVFEDIVFIDVPQGVEGTDSLKLTFSFTDGDGNLGLTPADIFPPFNEFNFFIDSMDRIVTQNNLDSLVPPFYTVPFVSEPIVLFQIEEEVFFDPATDDYAVFGFQKEFFSNEVLDIPFACPGLINQDPDFSIFDGDILTVYNRVLTQINGRLVPRLQIGLRQSVSGTIPVVRVEAHNNVLIEFQRKVLGEFEPVDFLEGLESPDCSIGEFSGRLPLFTEEARIGTITYAMQSQIFRIPFADDTIRIQFQLLDRDLNRSNVAFSREFVLSDITQ